MARRITPTWLGSLAMASSLVACTSAATLEPRVTLPAARAEDEQEWDAAMRALSAQLADRMPTSTRARRLLVLDFTTSEGALCGLSAPVVEEVQTLLAGNPAFSVIERRPRASSTDPLSAQWFDTIRSVGAEAVVVGTLEPAADTYVVRCRLIVVATGQIASVAEVRLHRGTVEARGLCRGHIVAEPER
jgi:hypothetical protein